MIDIPGHQSENGPISHKPRFMTDYQSETQWKPIWAWFTLWLVYDWCVRVRLNTYDWFMTGLWLVFAISDWYLNAIHCFWRCRLLRAFMTGLWLILSLPKNSSIFMIIAHPIPQPSDLRPKKSRNWPRARTRRYYCTNAYALSFSWVCRQLLKPNIGWEIFVWVKFSDAFLPAQFRPKLTTPV